MKGCERRKSEGRARRTDGKTRMGVWRRQMKGRTEGRRGAWKMRMGKKGNENMILQEDRKEG